MNYTPCVSVVIPCYNHACYVKETIQSVIDQDYENIELIIIDDGSKDESVDKIQEMLPACMQRFKRFEFRHRSNKGLCATLNEAIEWCRGVYISCVASDDILLSDKTSYQVQYLANNKNTIGVFGEVDVLDEEGRKDKNLLKKAKKNNFNDIFTYRHRLPAPTQMLRLDAVKSVGGFRDDLIIEDWSMWLFLTESGGTLDYLGKTFAVYRRHPGNLSGRLELMSKGRFQILEIFKDKPGYNKACAMAWMVYAHDVQAISKKRSLLIALGALKRYPLSLFSKSFILFFIKMLLSTKV